MSELAIFKFETVQVRTLGTAEIPLFVASDVASALGYKLCTKAVSDHVDAEDIIKVEIETNGGRQLMNCVNESGLYALIFGSQLESAKRFKRWVTSEVLPAIRKNGAYVKPAKPKTNPMQWVKLAMKSGDTPEQSAGSLMAAAAFLQLMGTIKDKGNELSYDDIRRGIQAFENELDEDVKRHREEVSEKRRLAVKARWANQDDKE